MSFYPAPPKINLSKPSSKFIYDDHVKVTGGFYKFQRGTVKDVYKCPDSEILYYTVQTAYAGAITVEEEYLEKERV